MNKYKSTSEMSGSDQGTDSITSKITEMNIQSSFPLGKKRKCVDTHQCVICGLPGNSKDYVHTPTEEGIKTLVACVKQRSDLCDPQYSLINRKLATLYDQTTDTFDVTYHRACYQTTTNRTMISRIEKKFKETVGKPEANQAEIENDREQGSVPDRTTRSSVNPFDKSLCFFCQTDNKELSLHRCLSKNMSHSISECIKGNQVLEIRMNSAIGHDDARAIDVKYHLRCFTMENRRSQQRLREMSTDSQRDRVRSAEFEFTSLVESYICGGSILSMADCEQLYLDILQEYGVDVQYLRNQNRPHVRKLLTDSIPHIRIVNSTTNKSASVASTLVEPAVMDAALNRKDGDLHTLVTAAKILRKHVFSFEHSRTSDFKGTLVPSVDDVAPWLYMFFKVLLVGTNEKDLTDKRQHTVNTTAIAQSLSISYAIKSEKQVHHKPNEPASGFRNLRRENVQVLATGMATRKYCRKKGMVDYLNKLHVSLPNYRLLQIESSLANSIISSLQTHPSGRDLVEFLVDGQFLYFHIDNCDFTIDTSDGKGQLHGALIVLFQRKLGETSTYKIPAVDMSCRTYSIDPITFTQIQECDEPRFQTMHELPHDVSTHSDVDGTSLSVIQGEIYLLTSKHHFMIKSL